MDNGKCFVNGREVVTSGTVIAHSGEHPIEIYPFSDDQEYQITVTFVFEKDLKRKIRTQANEKGVELLVSNDFEPDGTFSSSRGLNFSSDSEYRYYISIAAHLLGSIEKHTIIFTYTITKEEKA